MSRIRVMLADDHRMFSAGLARLLQPQFDIVGIVQNGRDLVAAAERIRPDVILVDISMPSLNGVEAARRIHEMPTPPRIVFLTMHEDASYLTAAFQAGACGYVLKRSAPSEVITAVREAMRGRIYVSSLVDGGLVKTVLKGIERTGKLKMELTSRQREILQLLAEGKSPKEIAAMLNVSTRTVEFHKYRIVAATGARTIAELTRYAVAHGIVQA